MKSLWPPEPKLKVVNHILLGLIVLTNLYVIGSPLLPQAELQLKQASQPMKSIQDDDYLSTIDRSYNHVVIPRLRLDERIHEGESESTANLGVWRRPQTAKPGQNNNTVLVGHRFTYDGGAVFYSLDRVQPKDEIVVVYDGKLYLHRVMDQKVVAATAVEIEEPTAQEQLTIYTCTPIWSAKDRLVLTTRLERVL